MELIYTKCIIQKSQQRGIPLDIVKTICAFGAYGSGNGDCEKYTLTHDALEDIRAVCGKALQKTAQKYLGVSVITNGNKIITVKRNSGRR